MTFRPCMAFKKAFHITSSRRRFSGLMRKAIAVLVLHCEGTGSIPAQIPYVGKMVFALLTWWLPEDICCSIKYRKWLNFDRKLVKIQLTTGKCDQERGLHQNFVIKKFNIFPVPRYFCHNFLMPRGRKKHRMLFCKYTNWIWVNSRKNWITTLIRSQKFR